MLPFLKNRQEGSASGNAEDDPIERKHDDDYDMLDAVAQDVLAAIAKKDVAMLKAALQSLCEHIQDQDIQQDQSMMGDGDDD